MHCEWDIDPKAFFSGLFLCAPKPSRAPRVLVELRMRACFLQQGQGVISVINSVTSIVTGAGPESHLSVRFLHSKLRDTGIVPGTVP